MTEPSIVSYECKHRTQHRVPGDDVRVLKTGQAGFVLACDCAEEPLDETHEPPHPGDRHLANVYGKDPSPEEWLDLEEVADGWYDTDPWEPVDGKPGVWAQVRQRFREQVAEIADDRGGIDGGETEEDVRARDVECPNCSANPGVKCQRPSGHTVRKCHADRIELAKAEGVIDGDPETSTDQLALADPDESEHDPEPLARNEVPKSTQTKL